MAATTGITPVEEENPTPMMDKKDPHKKAEAVMAATTQVPLVMPLADERMAQMVEDAPKKFEAMKMAGEEEEEEVPKKVVVGGQEKKDIGLNGKGEAFWSQEVKIDEAERDKEVNESEKIEDAKGGAEGESSGTTEELALQDTEATVFVVEPTLTPPLESNDAEDTGGAAEVVDHENKVDGDNIIEDVTNVIDVDNDKVEGDEGWDASRELEVAGQDDKSRTLDVGEVMKDDDNREPVAQDIEVAIPMVEPGPVVEYNSKVSELGEEKCELWKEQEEKVVATVEEKVADKMIDDVKAAMIEEEKSEPKGEKGEEAGYGGGNGGELGGQKEVEVSAISVEAPKLGDEVAPFAKASGELGYEKDASGDLLIMGGEEAIEESATKDVDVEDEIAKLEFASEFVHGGSIKEVYPASTHRVHANSHGKEKNAEGQINASEVVEEVGTDKPLEVENVAAVVEDTSLEKPTEIENVAIEVEVIDIEKLMEVENVIASSDHSILSQELALESSKENNNVEETEGATSVVDHKEEIDHDNIIDAMTNVVDAKNDEAEGFGGENEGGEVEEVVEGAKGESSAAAEEPTLQDIEATVFVVEPTPTPPLEFNDVEDTEGASGVVDHENMVDDDDIIKDMTNVIDAHNDNVEGGEEGDGDGLLDVVEEDAKARNLDVGEAMKDDGSREPVVQDVKIVVPMVEPAPPVEYKLKRSELGEDAAAMAPPDTPEGEDKGKLWKEREEKVVATVEAKAADKMAGDVKAALTEEEKREPDGEKDDEVGYGGGDGGELGEGKEIEVSTISIDTIKLCDEVSPFTEASGEVGYEKEGSGDIRIMGGEQALEESTNKDVDVEDEFVKPKLASEVVHGGCVAEVYPASAHSVLKSSHGKDKNVEGQTNASEVVKDVGVQKPLKVDNIGSAVKYIDFEKPSQIENVATEVEGIDDENPMEVKNIVASTVDGILSLELAPKSSKENNNVEETKGATKVVIHEEKVDDDGIIDAMTNVIDAKNNEVEGDRGGDVMLKEHSKGGSLGAGEAMKDGVGTEPVEQDTEVVVSMVETIPEQTLEPKWGNSEIGENEDVMASPDAPEGGDKGELKMELEEEVDVMVEVKVINDAKTTVVEEEKELESEKGKQLDYEGGDGYGGKSNTVVVHDGSIDEVDPASRGSVLEDSHEENQNVEGQANASKAMEYIGVGKPLFVEVATMIEKIDVSKPIKLEIVVAVAEDIDVEKPMEVENVVMYSDDGIISQELGKDDTTMASLDALEGEEKGEFWEEQKEEEVGASAEVKIMYKVGDDVKVALVDQDKLKPEGAKGDEVDYGGGDSGKLEEEKEAKVSVEADDPEDEVTLLSKDEGGLGYNKESNSDKVVVGGEEASEESIGKGDAIEDDVTKPKPVSEASVEVNPQSNFVDNNIGSIGNANNSIGTPIQTVYDGSIVEVDLASADSVFEDSPDKEQNTEGISTASGAMEDGGVKKPLGDENIVVVVEDIGVKKHIELQNIVVPVEGIDVEKPIKVQNVVVSSTDAILFQELAPESSIENNDAVEMEGATEVVDYEDEVNDDIRIKAMTDDENGAGDEADDGANSNTSGSSYTNNIFSSEDDSRILIIDQPAGLGSSASSMWPTPPHETAQSKILNTSEIALIDAHTEEMNEEDKKVTDKVELIKIKFLRLVYRLGATVEETVATQVMYRLSLAEGIIHGWQMNKDFNFDDAQKKALILEAEGKHDLNFSCNILVLGKTGVGKSATINSIFGEEKLKTDAFNSATTSVREIVGDVHGVKIRIIDTPGLLPNMMDQASNRKILVAVKKYTRKCPPDIVLYVDRLDCLSCDLNDLPLLKTITDILGTSIWFNTIVALTHAASPPEGLNGTPLPYEVLMAQSSHIIQQSIRQATRDMRLMNPVALIENHPSCRQNIDSQKLLPNDQSWRHQMLLLFYSAKILSEANSVLKLQDPNPENLSGFHFHSQPFYFLLSSLLQSRAHPKLSIEQGGNEGVSVPLPDIVLPPSFDCDNPTYRYRFLETSSTVQARPILDAHGWDHDCGYDGISMEDTLVILNRFPGNLEAQVTKNKKEFNIHLDSSIAAKYGVNASSLTGFDIQTVGQQLAYILHGETKIKNIKKNKTTGGFSVTFLGDIVATGLKVEDQVSLGKRLSLVACTGVVQAQGDTAYGANLEARLKDKDYPIGQSLSTLGLCLMNWHEDLALGANLWSQFSTGRGSKMALRLGLNNKLSGKITVKTSTSEHVQIALLGLVPVAASIYRSFRPSEP